jgi:hypothetical protein
MAWNLSPSKTCDAPSTEREYAVFLPPIQSLAAVRWSAFGTTRTWRDVRLESVVRTKADID